MVGRGLSGWWPTSVWERSGSCCGIEVSRLARRNADWYQLLDLCALTDTLIADADGVYHPGLHNDRLLLGIEGHDVGGRVARAAHADARRGAAQGGQGRAAHFRCRPDLSTTSSGGCGSPPDEAVADAIATVFAYFDQRPAPDR